MPYKASYHSYDVFFVARGFQMQAVRCSQDGTCTWLQLGADLAHYPSLTRFPRTKKFLQTGSMTVSQHAKKASTPTSSSRGAQFDSFSRSQGPVSETFFSRASSVIFSNFSRSWTRDALGAVPYYIWQNDHAPMLAWLSYGQRDYVWTLPKTQQFHTNWTARFSVGGRPLARIFGPCPLWGLQLLD